MLTLLLLRHAQAAPSRGGRDFDRPLTDAGITDVGRLATWMKQVDLAPDVCLVSPAARTRQTFDKLVVGTGWHPHARFDESLYSATPRDLRDGLRQIAERPATAMVVGHNPAISETALSLAAEGDPSDLERMRARFPPCSLVVLTFRRETWQEAVADGGTLDRFVTPDDLLGR